MQKLTAMQHLLRRNRRLRLAKRMKIQNRVMKSNPRCAQAECQAQTAKDPQNQVHRAAIGLRRFRLIRNYFG